DAGVARALQARGLGAVREHDSDGRRHAAIGDGVDDRLKVAAAPGNQDAEALHTDRTERSPATTNPSRTASRSPACASMLTTRCASRAAQAITSPMPMLKARNISSVEMPPRCCSTSK